MDAALGIYLVVKLLAVCAAKDVFLPAGSGTYLGKVGVSENGESYFAFLGVRFAWAERFSKPILEEPVVGVYNATFSRDECIQVMIFEDGRVDGKEDCLFLDIYAPINFLSSIPKSVMVWIHGGELVTGNAQQFDGSSLSTEGDVIVVVIQYRLGAFGFLSTVDDVLPGNYGLWDQLTALQWIKDNIVHFGGDPHSVTIFGESAGGCSANLHLISPKSKGFFKRVISQSAISCIKKNQRPVTYALAKLVGCFPTESSGISSKALHTKIVDCLKGTDAKTLCTASWPLDGKTKFGVLDFIYTASIDGEFLLNDFYDLLADKDILLTTSFPKADLMMSVNNNEGLAFYFLARKFDRVFNTSEKKSFQLLSHFDPYLLTPYLRKRYGITSQEMDTVTFEYIYHLDLSTTQINKTSAVKFITDTFVTLASDLVTSHSDFPGTGRTYLYLFDHEQQLTNTFPGMIHGLDLLYTFGFAEFQLKAFLGSANATIPPSEREISNFVIKFLTDFAKTGNPSTSVVDKIPGGWPQFNRTSQSYLSLNSKPSIKQHMYPRVTSFWGNLVPRLVSAALNRSEPVNGGGQAIGGNIIITHFTLCLTTLLLSLTGGRLVC